MPAPPRAAARWRIEPPDALAWLLLLLAILAWQAWSGALTAELTTADEPAHFISGLMVRDFLASGRWADPLAYAHDYYAHYPKIAIGNWPPLFYVAQALWLLPLPASPAAVLVLIAMLTATLGALVFRLLRPRLGMAPAAFGAALVLVLWPVPAYLRMIMLETVLALLTTIAVLLWVRFLERERLRDAVAFGAASLIAVLTKGNALFLALLPAFAIPISGHWRILRSRALWLAALMVLLVAGPWMVYFFGAIRSGWRGLEPSLEHVLTTLHTFARALPRTLGVGGTLLLLLGLWVRVVRPAAGRDAFWASFAALIPAVILLHALVPADTGLRHLIPAYPAIAMMVAAGAHAVVQWLHARGVPARTALLMVLGMAGALFALQAWREPPSGEGGYRAAAVAVLDATPRGQTLSALIVSDAIGEGAFVVEVARRDRQRPSHVVWRGSQLLSLSTWAGRGYRLRVPDDSVIPLLERAAIGHIVIDRAWGTAPHGRQLVGALAASDRFVLRHELPVRRQRRTDLRGLAVYERVGRAQTPARIRQVPGYDGIATVRGGRQQGGSSLPAP